MTTVRVTNSNLGGLSGDMAKIPPTLIRKGNGVVRKAERTGTNAARRINRAAAGPHGSNAFKRLTGEMTGPLSAEYGFTGDAQSMVGVGWRHGAGNTDLEKSQDVMRPKFHKDVDSLLGSLFW